MFKELFESSDLLVYINGEIERRKRFNKMISVYADNENINNKTIKDIKNDKAVSVKDLKKLKEEIEEV